MRESEGTAVSEMLRSICKGRFSCLRSIQKKEGKKRHDRLSLGHRQFNCYQLLWPPAFINDQVTFPLSHWPLCDLSVMLVLTSHTEVYSLEVCEGGATCREEMSLKGHGCPEEGDVAETDCSGSNPTPAGRSQVMLGKPCHLFEPQFPPL